MATPELSVILVNKWGFERLHRVLTALSEQSLASLLEIVIVSPFDPPADTASPFARVRHVKFSPINSLGPPRAAGVMACSAPYLAFGEDHCFPRTGWAEALVKRLHEGWTGVGPAIPNHNPNTWTSRADWLLNYGTFSPGLAAGPAIVIAPHNSAYSTAVLQGLAAELPQLLQMDHLLQARILSDGGRLYFEPEARSAHTNLSRLTLHWLAQFDGNRVYGSVRAMCEQWPKLRRGAYAVGFPAIAALRMIRACARLNGWREVCLLPLLGIASTAAAAGEAWGYVAGSGDSLRRRAEEELNRPAALIEEERHLLLPP